MTTEYGLLNESNREQFVRNALLNISPGKRILDAGAGTKPYKKYCQHLEYVSQDSSQYDGKGNGEGLQTGNFDYGKIDLVCDIDDIDIASKSFDAILCTEVLEHVPYPDMAIGELARLLKTGGTLILTAPFCSLTHFAPQHYSTGFSKYWYEHFLSNYDLEILSMVPNGSYFEYLSQELNRLPYVINDYCHVGLDENSLQALNGIRELLSRVGNYDTSVINSSELLCFGYHVIARKR